MNRPVREFNQGAYDSCDSPCKQALVSMMESRGYELIGDPDGEYYKNYDMLFVKQPTGERIAFENEMRENYDMIKNVYSSIHIPIRKKVSKSNYYVVWNYAMDEFALISMNTIRELASHHTVEIFCKARNGRPAYSESFIDVPKEFVTFYMKATPTTWKAIK